MTADERRISDWSSDVCSSDLITVSSARADKLAGLGIERGRITVLRNGVDPAVFRPVEASGSDSEGSGGVPPPRPLAVSVGNLVPLKGHDLVIRSEEHTSELQSLMRISYAVFCLKKKTTNKPNRTHKQ